MTVNFIIPPHLIQKLAETETDPDRRARWEQNLRHDHDIRDFRAQAQAATLTTEQPVEPPAEGGPDRVVYDARNGTDLPGWQVRAEGESETGDVAVDQAYDGTGATWELFSKYGRDSIDGAGMQLKSTVHYDQDYNNAFWDGQQMVFGDGDGEIFQGFTNAIDVTAHELTHGVTQYTTGLEYQGQSGALNESISDVFGSLTKQYQLDQTAEQADWIIGEGLFTPDVNGVGLRSMKEPGTAYDDPRLGKDPQPATMDDYVETTEDNGGVHINSGIPNHAFYLAATKIGGYAWEGAGKIWYHAITSGKVGPTADFAAFAKATVDSAKEVFSDDPAKAAAVTEAWQEVGVDPASSASGTEQQLDVAKFLDHDGPARADGQTQAGSASDAAAAVRPRNTPDRGFGR
jgi:Zn-dependent metalloprotease